MLDTSGAFMKTNLKYVLFFFALLIYSFSFGQQVKVYRDFDEFAPLLQRENDTTYVVNFWATWCKPCVEEMPGFQELNKKFEGKKFKLILVSLDFESNIKSKVLPFIKEHNVKADVVLLDAPEQNKWIDRVNKSWSGAIPITVIYNKDFYFFREGTLTYEELDKIVSKNMK
ncbi:MAG: TlpA family protein disulfide reductase [Chlorobi bacterium]|nr:TlpA family protein disulfide reductase [Chlorobiota bacterium]